MAAADTPISPVWRHFLAEEVCKIPFPRKSSVWWGAQDQETVGKDEVLEYTQDHLDAIAANKQAQWYSRCRLGFIQALQERQSWFLDALRS